MNIGTAAYRLWRTAAVVAVVSSSVVTVSAVVSTITVVTARITTAARRGAGPSRHVVYVMVS
jgi:hypothetical protein